MYSPYAMDMIYEEECASRDHEILFLQARLSSMSEMIKNMSMRMNQPEWETMSPQWSQAENM